MMTGRRSPGSHAQPTPGAPSYFPSNRLRGINSGFVSADAMPQEDRLYSPVTATLAQDLVDEAKSAGVDYDPVSSNVPLHIHQLKDSCGIYTAHYNTPAFLEHLTQTAAGYFFAHPRPRCDDRFIGPPLPKPIFKILFDPQPLWTFSSALERLHKPRPPCLGKWDSTHRSRDISSKVVTTTVLGRGRRALRRATNPNASSPRSIAQMSCISNVTALEEITRHDSRGLCKPLG